ncbi:MAG: sulfotransferase [Propionibacteriales bacterium]|nr:sulfotransferase [Propionibacteriales bacterium]
MDAAAGPATSPIFVVGSMRSGSTMLRLILDSHPNIAIGSETGFMGALLATKTIPNWKFGKEWYRRLDWTEEEFDGRLRDFYSEIFARYASTQGKGRWGEKTPFHTAHIETMAQVFPTAVFVGIIRHPGAVAASLRKSFHYTFADGLSHWTAANLDMMRAGTELGSRFVACRYEDLVLEGESVLRELMSCLGESWSPDLLQHHVVQRDKGAPRAVEGSTITRDPIDATRAIRWTHSATDDDYRALQSTSALAAFFGYEAVDPTNRLPLVPSDRGRVWIPDGDDLLHRRQTQTHPVDFEQRPSSPVIDADPEELANRLAQVEAALARTRDRKAVRMADAFRKVQHGRSRQDLRKAWNIVRGHNG